MPLSLHQDIKITRVNVGNDNTPVVVVDHFVAQPELLVEHAAAQLFSDGGKFYPGIRCITTKEYQRFFARFMAGILREHFNVIADKITFSMCHYSLVTVPPEQLNIYQRVPHVDATNADGYAAVHYLFTKPLGGTAFYRHKQSGFEVISDARQQTYFALLASQRDEPAMTTAQYINKDNALFEQIGAVDGVYNRLVIYPKNILHSGLIGDDFIPDSNPLTGRLSINSFIEILR